MHGYAGGVTIYPARRSNEITKEYYNFLVGQMNRGTTKHKVSAIMHRNGTHTYSTYHLISVP